MVACQVNDRTAELHVSEFLAELTQVLAVTQFSCPFACQLLKLDVRKMKVPMIARVYSSFQLPRGTERTVEVCFELKLNWWHASAPPPPPAQHEYE